MDLSQIIEETNVTVGIPGVLIDGVFWYWDGVMTQDAILTRRRIRSALRMLRGLSIGIGTLGVGLFVLRTVLAGADDAMTSAYWQTPQPELFALWFGMLSWCFAWYTSRTIASEVVEIPRAHRGSAEEVSLDSLSATSQKRGMLCAFDASGRAALEDGLQLAIQAHHEAVTPEHVFVAACTDVNVRVVFARLGLSLSSIVDPLRRSLAAVPTGETVFGDRAVALARKAFFHAASAGSLSVSALDVFAVCYEASSYIQEVLYAGGADTAAVQNVLAWMHIQDALYADYRAFRSAASLKPTGNMDRAYTAVATPFLDSVSEDLTKNAVYGRVERCVERDQEIAAVYRAIEGGGQSVVLVGQPGVGRGAILSGIARNMVEERVPDILKDKRLVRLDIARIVSAEGGIGAEERLLYALQEVALSGNIVLVIENIHELIGIGGTLDLSAILAGELEKGYTFVLATSTPSAYVERMERSSLAPRFEKILVEEPDQNLAIRILESHVGALEYKHGIAFTYQALAACVELAARYLHDSVLPTSALRIAEDAALVVSKLPRTGKISWVTREHVAARVSEKSHVPVTSVSQEEKDMLLQLELRLHERVIGQEEAIRAVSAALRRARTQMRATNRPIANFLFLGPTGVGKTELAKATAEVYFGNEQSMVRFDMSEYQDQASVARLIGGNGQTGLFTEALRRTPFSLVLLDELEKAHPDILNVFLQVMDDGRVTDGLGRTIDCTNAIIIATSNAGTQYIQDEVAKGTALDVIKTGLLEEQVRESYRPEFLNRFDDVIVFTPLTADDVAAIAYLFLNKVTERLKAKGVEFRIDDEAVHELAQLGYDPKFGARPLRRVLQDRVENVIAERILQGDVGRRDTVVYHKGGEVTVEKARAL